jgi:N-acetylglucosamine kinase-like BadF-type ATPase
MASAVAHARTPSIRLGIYGGHHRSRVLAYDADRDQVYPRFQRDTCLSIHRVSTDEFATRLKDLIHEFAREQSLGNLDDLLGSTRQVVIALPGVGLERDYLEAQDYIRGVLWPDHIRNAVEVIDDTWAGLFAETAEKRGVCIFAGVGASVCLADGDFLREKAAKIDGWGPVVGDRGSGVDLVLRFLRECGSHIDRLGGRCTWSLVGEVARFLEWDEHLGDMEKLHDFEYLHKWMCEVRKHHRDDWPERLSRLALPILDAADGAERRAVQLVNRCADEVARSTRMALRRAPAEYPVILQGWMFRRSRAYTARVISGLGIDPGRVRLAEYPPEFGCLMLACLPGEPDNSLARRVRDLQSALGPPGQRAGRGILRIER